jgi:hypothetical protein
MLGRERFSDIVGQVDRPARRSSAERRQAQGQHVGYRNVVKATPGLPTPAAATDDANELADEIEASFQARARRGRLHSSIDTLTDYPSNGRFAPRVPLSAAHVSVIRNPGAAKTTTETTTETAAKTKASSPSRSGSRRRPWGAATNENLT